MQSTSDDAVPIRWQCPLAVETRVYTAKSDVYSFGVLLFEIYSGGSTPYASLVTGEVIKAVRAGERLAVPRADTPPDIIALMRQCTQLSPALRPSMATIHAKLRGAWTLVDSGVATNGVAEEEDNQHASEESSL
jgi:serine/threonine protein kinase